MGTPATGTSWYPSRRRQHNDHTFRERRAHHAISKKANLYLASTIPRKLGYERVTWNLLEASHGKGPADDIGGAIKRQADRFVAEGNDIPDVPERHPRVQRIRCPNPPELTKYPRDDENALGKM